jgi:hypothetical protein
MDFIKKLGKGWHGHPLRHRFARFGVKTKQPKEKTASPERLKRLLPTNVHYEDSKISFSYDGTFISNHVHVKKHEGFVGVWHKFRNDVYIDKDLKTKRDLEAVALHESIEKYVSQKYGFNPDGEAHNIANAVEKAFLERMGGKWDAHQEKVKEVWREEGEQ